MVFLLLFRGPLTFFIVVGGNRGQGEIKMASASIPSANEQAKDFFLKSHSTTKTNDKAHVSGRMISSGLSDIVIASVFSEKTHLKKLL